MKLISGDTSEAQRWIDPIRQGNVDAFEQLYRHYYTDLTRFMARYVRLGTVAEELYQDIFFDIWQRRATWRPQGSVKAYLFRAAHNRAIDYLRRQQRERKWIAQARLRAPAEVGTPEAELCYQECAEALQAAVAGMPERRRLIFLLSREHSLTYREIADALDISIKTVETQMGRALRMLRNELLRFTSRVA